MDEVEKLAKHIREEVRNFTDIYDHVRSMIEKGYYEPTEEAILRLLTKHIMFSDKDNNKKTLQQGYNLSDKDIKGIIKYLKVKRVIKK